MKLLSPKETDAKRVSEQASRALLSSELDRVINARKAELNKINDEYARKTIELSEGFDKFCLEQKVEKSRLEKEIQEIRDERSKQLEPIDQISKRVQESLADAEILKNQLHSAIERVKSDELLVTDTLEKLEDARDELEERKEDFKMREFSIESQEQFLKESQAEFSKKWNDYQLEVARKDRELLAIGEQLQADRASLEVLQKETLKDKENIIQERKQIADIRETLQRGFDELRKKRL